MTNATPILDGVERLNRFEELYGKDGLNMVSEAQIYNHFNGDRNDSFPKKFWTKERIISFYGLLSESVASDEDAIEVLAIIKKAPAQKIKDGLIIENGEGYYCYEAVTAYDLSCCGID